MSWESADVTNCSDVMKAAGGLPGNLSGSGCSPVSPPMEQVDNWDITFHVILYKRTVPILFGLITSIGIIGNSIVAFIILSKPHMRTTINLSLLNLALCDLTFLTVCVPFMAYHYAADNWLMGDVMCKLLQFLLYVTVYVTVYTLVLISALRFASVVHFSTTSHIRTKRNIIVFISIIWAIMLMGNTPILFVYRVKAIYLPPPDETQPYYYCAVESVNIGRSIFMCFFFLAYLFPLAAIMSLYLSILRYLKRKRSESFRHSNTPRGCNGPCVHAAERTSHATRIVIIVVVVFGMCWLPLHLHLLNTYYGKLPEHYLYQVFRMLCHCFAYANSCMNPFIYHYASKDFRQAFDDIWAKCKPGRKAAPPENMALKAYEASAV